MTPERISELRKWVGEHVLEGQCLVDVDTDEVLDLLDTAEREAVLRDALETIVAPDMWIETSDGSLEWRGVEDFMDIGRTALTKGGGS